MLRDFVWTPELIEDLVSGQWVNAATFRAQKIATSSRKPAENALFMGYADTTFRRHMGDCNFVRFAREGQKFGNLGAARRAATQGWAVAMIVDRELDVPVPQLVVEDAFAALEALAMHKRSLVRSQVIAVTGTVGKSSTLKALDAILGERSVRLTRFNVRDKLAVAMANAPIGDERSYLLAEVSVSALWGDGGGVSHVLCPDVAVLTEVGLGMTHRVPTVRDTAEVKANLINGMSEEGVLLYNTDMKYADCVRNRAEHQPVVARSFGFGEDADYRIIDGGPAEGPDGVLRQTGVLAGPLGHSTLSIPAFGKAHLYANAAAVAVADAAGENIETAVQRVTKYRPSGTAERVTRVIDERVEAEHLIIDGTFSATPLSMRHSFDLAAQMHAHTKKGHGELIGVLGRIVALGDQAEETHLALAEPLAKAGFTRIYTYGPDLGALSEDLTAKGLHAGHYERTEELAENLVEALTGSSTILLKGSKRASDFRDIRRHIDIQFGTDTLAAAVKVTGEVQAVGYRKWAKSEASGLGLLGWVRNSGDDVEIRVQGPRKSVMEFLDACQQGPKKAKIGNVVHHVVGTRQFTQFRIRKTVIAETTQSASPPRAQEGAVGPSGFDPQIVAQAFGSHKLSAFTIALESWRRGLTVQFTDPTAIKYSVSDGTRRIAFKGSRSSRTTSEAIRTVENKNETLNQLRQAQVPVPKSRLFQTSKTRFEEVLAVAEREYRWPVVIKPVHGSRGDGVFANITSAQELRDLYEHLTTDLRADWVLVEEHMQGDDYRVYVVGEEVVGAVRRVPANVVGDGSSTVRQLVKAKNSLRKQNPFLSKGLIRRDVEIDRMLSGQGLDYESVPAAGMFIPLRHKANASAGGDVLEATDELPDEIRMTAVAAIRAINGLPVAAVDVLWDRNAETVSGSFVVIELNARAHIGVNMYPTTGTGTAVPQSIVDYFFPETAREPDGRTNTLAFNLDSVLQPLRDGSASQVQVAKLPDHGYPVRRVIERGERIRLTAQLRQRILSVSRRYGVAGSLEIRSGTTRLVVAGEEQEVSDFLASVGKILRQDLTDSDEWHGPVMMGFCFSTGSVC